MLLVSFERLGTFNYQLHFAKVFAFVNEKICSGEKIFQSTAEITLRTERFPEGHVYPMGTVFMPETTAAPAEIRSDIGAEVLDFSDRTKFRKLRLPKGIAVYNGLNCWPYFFDPYKKLLDLLGIPFTEADDRSLRDGLLDQCELLVVPGGPDAGESYYAGLGDRGIENIRRFIHGGGCYIGSCAGSYFPLCGDESLPESRMLLGIVNARDVNGMDFTQRGTALVRLALSPEGPGALFSLSYGSYRSVDAIYWEGPVFSCEDSSVRVLARFQTLLTTAIEWNRWQPKNTIAADAIAYGNPLSKEVFETQMRNMPAAIEADYGKGRFHLYAFHPEFGSPTADSWENSLTLLFVINSIYDLASR